MTNPILANMSLVGLLNALAATCTDDDEDASRNLDRLPVIELLNGFGRTKTPRGGLRCRAALDMPSMKISPAKPLAYAVTCLADRPGTMRSGAKAAVNLPAKVTEQ
jgi:hypothetical protein